MEGESESVQLLKNKWDLHSSDEVKSATERTKARTGEKVPQDPSLKIQNYLNRFHEITNRVDSAQREHGLDAAKRLLYGKFVIKPDQIPESYFENQRRLAREMGYGDIEITRAEKEQLAEVIIADQRSSLDKWIDYLSSSDAPYSDGFKYYVLRSILNMGTYDKKTHAFSTRNESTVAPFPDLNREALAYVLDAVKKKYGKRYKAQGQERKVFEKNSKNLENSIMVIWQLTRRRSYEIRF